VSIVGGFDVHRRQITFDWVDRATGQAQRGQITPATAEVRAGGWHNCRVMTGRSRWRRARAGGWWSRSCRPPGGMRIWPSRPRPRRCAAPSGGPRPTGPTPSCCGSWWNSTACPRPGSHRRTCRVLRVLVRLRKTLVDERTAFKQRLHAVLFHHGLPCPDHALLTRATRGWLEQVTLPQASRFKVATALRQIDQLDLELDPLERWLRAFNLPPARLPRPDRQPLRDRDADRPDHPGRAGRCPPLCQRRRGRALRRPGRHRLQLRQQAQPRAPVPARPPGAALGVV
jgi:transposase